MNALKVAGNMRAPRAARILMAGLVATVLLMLPGSVAAGASSPSCAVRAQGTHTIYSTVQAALDASPSGAPILVRGICIGPTVVSNDATIMAAPDRASYRATLDGALGGAVITVNPGVTLELDRLVITGGYNHVPGGGGILNNGTLVLKRSKVVDNISDTGGGIANYGDATILSSRIDHNGQRLGGNIYNAGTLLVRDSSITRGGGRFGQGLWNDGTATLVRTSVTDNDRLLPFSGGGIQNGGDLTLDHSLVARNSAVFGGGVLNVGTLRILSSTIKDNNGDSSGGGIMNGPAFDAGTGNETLILIHSKVSGNTGNFGGGIYNKGGVTVDGPSRIGRNTAGGVGQGGGMYNDSGATVVGVTDATFTPANTPDDCVGCSPGG